MCLKIMQKTHSEYDLANSIRCCDCNLYYHFFPKIWSYKINGLWKDISTDEINQIVKLKAFI